MHTCIRKEQRPPVERAEQGVVAADVTADRHKLELQTEFADWSNPRCAEADAVVAAIAKGVQNTMGGPVAAGSTVKLQSPSTATGTVVVQELPAEAGESAAAVGEDDRSAAPDTLLGNTPPKSALLVEQVLVAGRLTAAAVAVAAAVGHRGKKSDAVGRPDTAGTPEAEAVAWLWQLHR